MLTSKQYPKIDVCYGVTHIDSNEPSAVYPRTINHIAVSVSNLKEAIKWYQDILGFTLIKQPREFEADDSLTGMAVKDFHSPKLKKMKIAWLTSANQVGFGSKNYVKFVSHPTEIKTKM